MIVRSKGRKIRDMDAESIGPIDQQPIKRIVGRKERGPDEVCHPFFISKDRIEFSRQKTRSGIAPKGVFRYKSHAQANADMETWISESIQRFEISKGQSPDFHDLVADFGKDEGH